MREVILDTETTGLSPIDHRVVEMGCIELINHVATGKEFHAYINPERDMPAEAEAVHGLSSEFLSTKPLFAAIADEFLAPDCIYHTLAPLPPGVEGVKHWVRTLRRAFPDLCAIVEDEIAEGDTVVQRLTLSGTHRGTFLGVPPTGRRATWQLVAIQRLGRDGRFAEHWSSPDLFGLLRQLGAVPAADAEGEA